MEITGIDFVNTADVVVRFASKQKGHKIDVKVCDVAIVAPHVIVSQPPIPLLRANT